jgi:hypothetical protein
VYCHGHSYLKGPPYGVIYAGNDREVLEREMAVIKELLEEQPDSKCMNAIMPIHLDMLIGFSYFIQGVWSRLCITKVSCCAIIR